jgi:PAS domain S-box-containing protein
VVPGTPVNVTNSTTKPTGRSNLLESEEEFRLLVEGAADYAIVLLDLEGRIMTWNVGVERILGYSHAEIIGLPVSCLYPKEAVEQNESVATLETAWVTGRCEEEGWRVRKDGSLFWANVVTTALRYDDGSLWGFALVTHDLTERRRGEESLRRERDFAESLIETAHCVVLVLDLRWRIIRFNRYLEGLAGHSLDEVLGEDWCELFLPPEEWARAREALRRVVACGQVCGDVSPILTRRGERRQISWWCKILQDVEDCPTAVLLVGHDVTGLLEAQDRALRAERLAAIGQTVSGVAHESRNALYRIQAGVELLRVQVAGDPQALEYSAQIERAAESIRRLVEELREYAAPLRLDRRLVSLQPVWRRAWANLEPEWSGRCAMLHDGHDQPHTLLGAPVDEFRLEQVFRILFENSLAACPEPTELEICCNEVCGLEGPALQVLVRDNGPGLTEDQREKVFEAFYTTKTKGTGLGLAIARRLVEAHGGTITAGTTSKAGAEFVITLPSQL